MLLLLTHQITVHPVAEGGHFRMSSQTSHPHNPHGIPRAPRNAPGVAAALLGIVALCAALIPELARPAGVPGLLALAFGLLGLRLGRSGRADNTAMAIGGAVLGIAATGMSAASFALT